MDLLGPLRATLSLQDSQQHHRRKLRKFVFFSLHLHKSQLFFKALLLALSQHTLTQDVCYAQHFTQTLPAKKLPLRTVRRPCRTDVAILLLVLILKLNCIQNKSCQFSGMSLYFCSLSATEVLWQGLHTSTVVLPTVILQGITLQH